MCLTNKNEKGGTWETLVLPRSCIYERDLASCVMIRISNQKCNVNVIDILTHFVNTTKEPRTFLFSFFMWQHVWSVWLTLYIVTYFSSAVSITQHTQLVIGSVTNIHTYIITIQFSYTLLSPLRSPF